uniref:Zeta-sarcoglycan n=1 Tax=Timema poppense TaxID=170557 RepID=A0A7R9H1F7_TIMPO|nr:unnamed protein product [Timema poppensis]
MGELRIVAGGIQLSGQAMVLDALLASTIRSRKGQHISIESSRNFTVNARDEGGRVVNRIFLGNDQLECLAREFKVTDARGTVLFSASKHEVVVGAKVLRVTVDDSGQLLLMSSLTLSSSSYVVSSTAIRSKTDAPLEALVGQESAPKPPPPLKDHTCKDRCISQLPREGGAIFDGTVQTPIVRADSGHELSYTKLSLVLLQDLIVQVEAHKIVQAEAHKKVQVEAHKVVQVETHNLLESPTRSLKVRAPLGVLIESRAGDISASCLTDLKLQSLAGAVRLDSANVFLPGLKTAPPPLPGAPPPAVPRRPNSPRHEIFQLCVCSNGKLFLASPEGVCAADDDSVVCRTCQKQDMMYDNTYQTEMGSIPEKSYIYMIPYLRGERVENPLEETTFCKPDRDSSLNLPVFGSII